MRSGVALHSVALIIRVSMIRSGDMRGAKEVFAGIQFTRAEGARRYSIHEAFYRCDCYRK